MGLHKLLSRDLDATREWYPEGYLLPQEYTLLKAADDDLGEIEGCCWILKEAKGNGEVGPQLLPAINEELLQRPECVVQKYVQDPLVVLRNRKFSIRIYVVSLHIQPQKVFISNKGLLVFCEDEYSKDDYEC